MVKKLKYLLFLFPLLSIINVNAQVLSPPTFFQHFDNGTTTSGTVASSTDNWSNTNVYIGGPIGSFGTNFSNVNQVDYNWFNLNICSGKNVSISGSIHAIFGFFLNQSFTTSFYMNNEQLTCSTSIFDNGNALHYDCYGETGGGTFAIYLTENSFTNNVNYNTAVSQDVVYSCDVSNEAIVNQSITNTQNIINNQNSNTNQIIQDNQQNTQDIIDNQNQNTQQEIESQKVCNIIDNNYIDTPNRFLQSNGSTVSSSSTYGITSYIPITSSAIIKPLTTYTGTSPSYCFYNTNKTLISCSNNSTLEINIPLNIPSNSSFVRFSIKSDVNKPTFEICKNGNQALTDSITSEDTPNTNQDLQDMQDKIASDTPITDLLTLPLTLINAYYVGITSTCSPYNFGNLLGTDIIFPCINLEQRLGSNLWLIIDSLCSIFLIYSIAMLFVHAFDNLTSLKDDFDDMYVPRHAGKHVGSGING